ncbi:unnamed protein product [Alopecurus aequalis]
MSDDSCNALFEQLRTLKIEPSSNSTSENNDEQLGHEAPPTNGEGTSKTILSPIAVRCAGRPPSLRKESKFDKLIRQAREKKKKAEQREKKKAAQKEKKKVEQEARSMNLKKKRSNAKRKSSEIDILQQEDMEHEESFDLGVSSGNINPTMIATGPYGTIQGSFNLGISTNNMNPTMPDAVPYGAIQETFDFGIRNINPAMAASLPSRSSSAMVMQPILGKYTSMLFQVQQNSAALSSSHQLNFDGIGEPKDTMDHSQK